MPESIRCAVCGVLLIERPFPDSIGYSGQYHVVVGGEAHFGTVCWGCYTSPRFPKNVELAVSRGAAQLTMFAEVGRR